MVENWQAKEEDVDAVVAAQQMDPFAVLGPHLTVDGWAIRAFVTDALSVRAITRERAAIVQLGRRKGDFFEGLIPGATERPVYRLEVTRAEGVDSYEDAYAFGSVLGPLDDHLLVEGSHKQLYRRLGAQLARHEGADGVVFAVWAPNASRVSVVGDFNQWDGRRRQMRKRIDSGLWEIFVPRLSAGAVYKYEIVSADGVLQPLKADPFGFEAEMRPSTASIVARTSDFSWTDAVYRQSCNQGEARRLPISIFEVHLGSWRRGDDNRFLSYDELADQLIPYVVDLGFTHLELLPITEHPLDESWGYQPIGLFAPTRRFGEPEAFARFVDRAHAAGIGVILDWAPAHFPTDAHGLAHFDGGPLYEHADPRKGFHPDWNTAIYDFGRKEVANFLYASALYWIDRFHVDGLRVDAVASMLYLDYSRKAGEWMPNAEGGNENHEAIALPQARQRTGLWPVPRRDDDRGGIHRLRRRVDADQLRRPGFRLQVEHGLDARHPRIYVARPDLSALEPRQDDLRPPLRLRREFHPADFARRGRPRQRIAGRQDAGRRMAALRQCARLLRLHVGPSRQEAVVHGPGIRPDQRMELRRGLALAAARLLAAPGAPGVGARPQPSLSRNAGALRA